MDNSQQYIKMCFGAWPDLKENYQPAKGDFYKCSCKSCQNTDRIFMINDYDYDYVTNRNLKNVYEAYTEMVKNSGCGGFGAFWALWDDDGFFIIWKQDQLQGMIIRQVPSGRPRTLLIWLLNTVVHPENPPHNKNIADDQNKYWEQFDSMEQLWLSFVMSQKFGKVWNSDKEEWVKEKGGML